MENYKKNLVTLRHVVSFYVADSWSKWLLLGRLNARVMETAGKAFYGGTECACKRNSV